ncbi:zinc finger associated protein [Popillia japonica]|uniref:Zinc finger associated protein n=1 Tax=Popillia japonica TaxID=7064 RepID=A0AAW1KFN5_POPJA
MEQIRTLKKLLDKRRSSRVTNRNLFKDLNSVTNRNLFKDLNSDDHQSPPGVAPVDMDTSFCSTASLVRAVCPGSSKKRKGSSSLLSSPRRIKVTAEIHPPRGGRVSPSVRRVMALSVVNKTNIGAWPREDLNKIELSSPREHDRVRSAPQAESLPPLSGRPQRRRTPPVARVEAHTDQPPVTRENRVPLIVLREKSGWCGISAEIRKKRLNFLKAQNAADGVRVFSAAESDFMGIVKFLTNEKIPFHTYQLPSEKGLNVVIRGLPSEIPEDQILMHLRELGFSPDPVARMRRRRGGAPMPLVLVKLPKDQKNIYNLKELVSLDVSVETLRANPTIGQCYRCQRTHLVTALGPKGHAQPRCTAPRKCISCGGEHPSGDCPRPKSEPSTCANCGDTHPANYKGCTRCPKPRAAPTAATPTQPTIRDVHVALSQGLRHLARLRRPSARHPPPLKSSLVNLFQAVAAPTWTVTQTRLRESQTPKRRNTPPSRSRPPSQTPKAVILDPEPSRGANIVSMLAALQKLQRIKSRKWLSFAKNYYKVSWPTKE